MLVNIRVSAGTSSSNGLSVLEQQGSKVKRGPQAARPLFGGVGLSPVGVHQGRLGDQRPSVPQVTTLGPVAA